MTIKRGGYTSASECAGGSTVGAKALMAFQLAAMPGSTNLGIYVCRTIAGTSRLSVHATGRALDNGTGTGKPTTASRIHVEQLRLFSGELGVQGIIHARLDWWSNGVQDWTEYGGSNPHDDHIHTELDLWAAANLTVDRCRAVLYGPAPHGASVRREWSRLGSTGPHVQYFQRRLRAHGFGIADDGIHGPKTDAAIRVFQGAVKIGVDGIVGPQTQGRLQ